MDLRKAYLEFLLKFYSYFMLEFIVLILYFMRLHSLIHEKRKKIVLNSKWRQNPRWNFVSFQNAFLRSFYLPVTQLL
jgi:hypothetical protein